MTRRTQGGQALVLTAVALVALLAVMGLAIDMGVLRYDKRLQQTAADAAALAGGTELQQSSDHNANGDGVQSSDRRPAYWRRQLRRGLRHCGAANLLHEDSWNPK